MGTRKSSLYEFFGLLSVGLRFIVFGPPAERWQELTTASAVDDLPTGTILSVRSRFFVHHYGVLLRAKDAAGNSSLVKDLREHPSYCILHYQRVGLWLAPKHASALERLLQATRILGKSFANLGTLEQFSGGLPVVYRLPRSSSSGHIETVFRRANEAKEMRTYNMFWDNCQHLALTVSCGTAISETYLRFFSWAPLRFLWLLSISILAVDLIRPNYVNRLVAPVIERINEFVALRIANKNTPWAAICAILRVPTGLVTSAAPLIPTAVFMMWLFSIGRQARAASVPAAVVSVALVMILASRKLSTSASHGVAGISTLFLLARLPIAAWIAPFLSMAWLHQEAPGARVAALFVGILSVLSAAATSTHLDVHH